MHVFAHVHFQSMQIKCILYHACYQANTWQIYACTHANRKDPMLHYVHASFHACPSPCLPIKFTCHVCVWSSCHIIIAHPDLAPGRCNGHLADPQRRQGQPGTSRPPPPLSLYRMEDQGLQLGGQGATVKLTCQPVSQRRRRRAG